MTATDLDALIERLPDVERKLIVLLAKIGLPAADLVEIGMLSQAAAALVQLREENALLHGLRADTIIRRWKSAEAERNEWKCEALVRRDRIAALEAERDALTKDAARYRWLQLEDRRRKEKP